MLNYSYAAGVEEQGSTAGYYIRLANLEAKGRNAAGLTAGETTSTLSSFTDALTLCTGIEWATEARERVREHTCEDVPCYRPDPREGNAR
jgi:hypothetical protein